MKDRLLHYGILLIGVIVLNFFIPRLLPGSPVGALLGDDPGSMTAAEKMGILQAYHLDRPMWEQFFLYLKEFFTLNWGHSFSRRQPIIDLIRAATGWTILLALVNLLISSALGIILGAVSAIHNKKIHGLVLLLGTTLFSSLPTFGVGIFLIAIFSIELGWFPLYGAYSMWSNYQGLRAVADVFWHMFLPILAMVINSLMMFFITARFGVLNTITKDYVHMARVRGISNRRIFIWYIMRNTMVPVFTIVMMDIGYILSGSVIIETVFSYPGLGMLMHNAVSARDYPLIQYTFLLASFVTIAALFFTDILYHRIDPRIEVDNA